MEKVETKKPRRRSEKVPKKGRRFFDKKFKMQIVRLHLEDGHSISSLCSEAGISASVVGRWIQRYKDLGESAFTAVDRPKKKPQKEVYPVVQEAILSLKASNPKLGLRSIVDMTRYFFHLPVGIRAVRTTLVENGHELPKTPQKRKKNVQKVRRFERTTPNQMWQSDIMMVRMGGRQLYLVGYIDDYSRFIVGLGLFQQQTADNVREVYLQATTEHAVPREMLTDNGRQYANWRGETKFQKLMKKDKVKHIRSQPQHPMTLGKIERFWQTILGEFFEKARFVSLEDAKTRLQKWVQYYNFRRPHQGIGGLCPSDRYFEVAHELRKTIEKGIEENVQELALRGTAKKPFFMLGRMGSKDVVLRAHKGKLTFSVNDEDVAMNNEQSFEFMEGIDGDGAAEGTGDTASEPLTIERVLRGTTGGSGSEDMGGETDTGTDLQGDVDYLDYIESMGEAGDGGHAAGSGAPRAPRQRSRVESAPTESPGEASALIPGGEVAPETEGSAGEYLDGRLKDGRVREGSETVGSDSEGPGWASDGNCGSRSPGRVAEHVLRVGAPGPGGDDDGSDGSGSRSSSEAPRSGEGGSACREGGFEESAVYGRKGEDPAEDSGRLRTASELAIARLSRHG